jgi:hypothetical protein
MLQVPVFRSFRHLGIGILALRKHPHGPLRNQPNALIYKRFQGGKSAGRDDVYGASKTVEKALDSHMMDHCGAGRNPYGFAQERSFFPIAFNKMHVCFGDACERRCQHEAGEPGARSEIHPCPRIGCNIKELERSGAERQSDQDAPMFHLKLA